MGKIKEKVFKAWLGDLEVVVCFGEGSELTGYVKKWDSEEVGINYSDTGMRPFAYDDITDIRFVGEGEESEEWAGHTPEEYQAFKADFGRWLQEHTEPPGEDKPSTPEPERWRVGEDKSTGIEIWNQKGITIGIIWDSDDADLAAGAPQMRDALELVTAKSNFRRITRGGHDADEISVKFNPDEWRVITDALEKAG